MISLNQGFEGYLLLHGGYHVANLKGIYRHIALKYMPRFFGTRRLRRSFKPSTTNEQFIDETRRRRELILT